MSATSEQRARREGYRAGRGVELGRNDYDPKSPEWGQWEWGWIDGFLRSLSPAAQAASPPA